MRVITATREAQLFLGKRGENLATQIQFPVVEQWTEQFGEGRFELAYQRPTEDAPYPCIVDVEDGNVLWNITDVELAIPGTGRAELFYIVDEAIAISVQFICRIADSLASGTPPEPWENWLEEILSAASDAEDARDDAESARDEAVQAKADAVDAKDLAVSSAESASADAERAETARSYAEIANDATQDAKTYAVDAKDVAVVASAEAIGAKEDALEASTDAINAASDAETYMNVALGAKDDAEDARDSALGAVNDIANYANTASSAAASALHSAEVASQAAENIEEVIPQHKGEYSATTTYKMNDIVSYNGATYWHYAAAESKGKAPTNSEYWVLVNSATKSIASISKTGTSGLVDTYTITYTDNSTPSTFTVTNGQRGTQVTAGSSLPASGMITGDLFVKTPDLELYQYSGSAWTYVADLRTPVDATLSNQGEAADAKAVGDALETKADKDGYYEDLSVGRADNLISNIALTDEVPYSFRTAGGALEISDPIREKAIVGLTSVWYQRASLEASSAASADGWTRSNSTYMSLTLNEGTRTYTLSSDTDASHYKNVRSAKEWITGGHIFFLCADIKASGTTGYISMGTDSASGTKSSPISSSATSFTHMATIAKATADSTRLFLRIPNGATSGSYAQFRDLQVFDLNRIFGKAVAEYLLARETASAGAGVEIFRSIFPNKFYAKDTGTRRSTMLSKKVSVGFNAYDAETGKALVVGGHDYKIEGNYTSYTYTPFGGVAETILASDTNASERSFAFGGTLQFTGADSNLCVHLKWDGERDGEKEEYKAHEYVLDDVELKGFWDVDENGNIFAFGDTYYPEGSITRKVGTALVSSLDWSYDATLQVFVANIETMKMGGHLACLATYERYTEETLTSDMPNKSYWNEDEVYTDHNIVVKNTSYTTVSAFTTALGAYTIYYELDTPTTESADPFTESQRVDNWGTEQYVDYAVEHNTRDVSMPYGHITEYPQDLKAKVEVMPDAPETDGDYLMRRENGTNKYVPFGNGLPDLPEDGAAYTLMCDTSGSTPTVSWESPMVITIEDDGEGGFTVDTTMQEINAAYAKGRRLVASYYGMRAELTFANTDFYTFMFVSGGWLFQGNIYYSDTTLVEVKRSVILDATGLDDHNRLPLVNVDMSTQIPTVEWERLYYGIDITYDSQNDRFVTDDTLGDIRAEMGKHAMLYLKPNEALPIYIGEFINDGGNYVLLFQEVDSVGAKVWTLVGVSDDAPAIVYPPQKYLASRPWEIVVNQDLQTFDFVTTTTYEEAKEAYEKGRKMVVQAQSWTTDGVNFFSFDLELFAVDKSYSRYPKFMFAGTSTYVDIYMVCVLFRDIDAINPDTAPMAVSVTTYPLQRELKGHFDVTMSQDANLNIQFDDSWTDLLNAFHRGDEITLLVDNITLDGVNHISAELPCGGKAIENGDTYLVFYLYTYALGNYVLYLYDDGTGQIDYHLL